MATDWTRPFRYLGTTAVAGIAAYASYWHMRAVSERFGESPVISALVPLSVDGMLVVATVAMVDDARAGRRPHPWTWTAFLAGVLASLAANVLHAQPSPVARLIAAWSPLALLLTVELVTRSRPKTTETGGTVPLDTHEPAAGAGREPPPAPASTPTPAPTDGTPLERMRTYWLAERAAGRIPSGAELDRAAGTRDYGRRMRRQWLTEEEGDRVYIA